MTTLFSARELGILLRRTVPDDEYELIHMLVMDAFQGEVGGRITDPPQPGVKSVALVIAARLPTNVAGLRSATAGAMSETYTDGTSGIALTADELRRLRRAVGLAARAGMLDIGPDDYRRGRFLRGPL